MPKKNPEEEFASESEEDRDSIEDVIQSEKGIDESDLTQLPGVNQALEKRLKTLRYDTVWEIAYADAEELAADAKISVRVAQKMIIAANKLLGFGEEGY